MLNILANTVVLTVRHSCQYLYVYIDSNYRSHDAVKKRWDYSRLPHSHPLFFCIMFNLIFNIFILISSKNEPLWMTFKYIIVS